METKKEIKISVSRSNGVNITEDLLEFNGFNALSRDFFESLRYGLRSRKESRKDLSFVPFWNLTDLMLSGPESLGKDFFEFIFGLSLLSGAELTGLFSRITRY